MESEKREGLPSSAKLVSAKPATPLPWKHTGRVIDDYGGSWQQIEGPEFVYVCSDMQGISEKDAAYIVAACNAYPKLVEALRECALHGGNPYGRESKDAVLLLRELGEI